MKTRILSFDVGVRNLAFVQLLVDGATGAIVEIERWSVVDVTAFSDVTAAASRSSSLASGGGGGCVAAVIRALDSTFGSSIEDAWDWVLIENQPCMKNPVMKTVQVAINAYFETLAVNVPGLLDTGRVRLVNASNKTRACASPDEEGPTKAKADEEGPKRHRYGDRKRASVAACRSLLGGLGEVGRPWLEMLESPGKRDDLCDAMMQADWFVRRSLCPPAASSCSRRRHRGAAGEGGGLTAPRTAGSS